MNDAYLSLGSNIDPETNLRLAVAMLADFGEIRVVSPVYVTEPVGAPGTPLFLNAALLLRTGLTARELKESAIAGIERELGRVRVPGEPNAPRTIDIDVALWSRSRDGLARGPAPDPDILRRAHVAVPLAAVAPHLVHPETGETLAAIAGRLVAACEGPPPRERPDFRLGASNGEPRS